MDILLVIDHLSSGGAQRQLVLLARELSARGHGVDCFVYHVHAFQRSILETAGIRILEHPKPSRYSARPIWELRRRLREKCYQAIVSFLTTPNLYSILSRIGLRPMPFLVVSERSSSENPSFGTKAGLVERLYRLADHVTVNSCHLRDHYLKKYGWMTGHISTIWNGVDLDRFRPTPLPRRSSTLRLLAMGQLASFKNCRCLIEALAILRDRHQRQAHVDWIARRLPNLTAAEFDYQREMNGLIAKLDLESNWRWLPERQDIEAALRECDALVHASSVEGLPNVVCEALACARPVFISDTLDHPRLIQEGKTGLLFDCQDPGQLADVLRRYDQLQDSQRQAMGNAARQFAEAKLSAQLYADQYEKLICQRP